MINFTPINFDKIVITTQDHTQLSEATAAIPSGGLIQALKCITGTITADRSHRISLTIDL